MGRRRVVGSVGFRQELLQPADEAPQFETMVKPHRILNDLGRESVALVHFVLCHGTNTGK